MIPNPSKQQIYDNAGALAKRIDAALKDVQEQKAWLDGISDATLLAAPFSCVQADIDVLRSAFNDMNQLATIYLGTANLAVAKDFRAFAKQTYAFGSHF